MPPTYFPLRWESTGDQWWYASPIDWAAANGHYEMVRQLLRLDGNHLIKLTSLRRIRRLETVWDDEEQFHDVAKNRSQVARKLFSECGSKKRKNSLIRAGYGGWLLYTAASAGDMAFVQELLEKDPLLVFGEGEYGVTDLLYAAARSKNSEVFRILFDFALSPRFSLPDGRVLEEQSGEIPSAYKFEMTNRAVHAAARGGNLVILKEILGDSSDVLSYRDVHGATVLHTAAGRGQVQIVNELVSSFNLLTSRDNQGNTALHVAAYRGQLAVVEALLLASPSLIHVTNTSGETFLHACVRGFQTPGFRRLDRQIELMKALVSGKMFNIEDIVDAKNIEGRTALHLAIIGNIHSDLVELLMTARYIDVNIRDMNGMTPLDILRQRPRSASSEILSKQLISAGGIFSCQDYSARKVIASNLKMLNAGSSPGTSFRISDTEIFLYTGIENVSDASSGILSSPCSPEPYKQELTIQTPYARKSTKLQSVSHAAQRLKQLLHWPKTKGSRDGCKKITGDVAISPSEGPPVPLRQRYSKPTSLPNHKRTLSASSNLPSPTAKKKFASGIVQGVMQAIPSVSRRSRSSSFSKSSFSSHGSLDKQKGIMIENEIAAGSCSNQLNKGSGSSFSFLKEGSGHRKSVNQYLCFGGAGVKHLNTASTGLQPYEIY